MIVARLRANGLAPRRAALIVGEMWLVFALWIGVLWAAAVQLAPAGGLSGPGDFHVVAEHFRRLRLIEKVLTVTSLAAGLAVFVHFVVSLNRAMQAKPSENDES